MNAIINACLEQIAIFKELKNTFDIRIKVLEGVIKDVEEIFPNEVPVITEEYAVRVPAKNNIKKTKPIAQKPGSMKFGTYVLNIFANKPGKAYTSKEICSLARAAIEQGKVESGTKDLASQVSGSLYAHFKAGKLEKWEDEDGVKYQYRPVNKFNSEEPNKSDGSYEIIIEKIKDIITHDDLTQEEISKKILYSAEYGDISKNLNGSLKNAVSASLDYLLDKKKIDKTFDGKYFIIN